MTASIRFENVGKCFGANRVLSGISGTIAPGEVVIVCGPSGSGKSTLIRTINRLESIDTGRIFVRDADIHRRSIDINAFRSRIGFVAQSFNLFSHLSAIDNVTIGLHRLRGLPRQEARDRAMAGLERFGLGDVAEKMPSRLSGGQQQRVAIVRALAMQPDIMLFDEPTSALDPELVGEVLGTMKALAADGMTMVCVTHEMGFARQVADRVWFLDGGRLVQDAATDEFFGDNPNARVRRFLNLVEH